MPNVTTTTCPPHSAEHDKYIERTAGISVTDLVRCYRSALLEHRGGVLRVKIRCTGAVSILGLDVQHDRRKHCAERYGDNGADDQDYEGGRQPDLIGGVAHGGHRASNLLTGCERDPSAPSRPCSSFHSASARAAIPRNSFPPCPWSTCAIPSKASQGPPHFRNQLPSGHGTKALDELISSAAELFNLEYRKVILGQ